LKDEKTVHDPRLAACRSLTDCERCGKYTNLEIDAVLEKGGIRGADRALYTAIVYGVTERRITLDHIISTLSAREIDRIDPYTKNALRVGLYQLLYLDRVPDHAAVAQTVEACPKGSRAFVNAILRTFIRNGKKYPMPDESAERASVEYSVPRELLAFWTERYGDERARSLAAASLRRGEVNLRVNTLRTSTEECLALLGEHAKASPLDRDVILFSGDGETLRGGIARGLWFVEDVSSRLAVRVLAPTPGSVTLDCCAAPGGKSFSCAIDMENRGTVYSFDLHENKLSLIEGTWTTPRVVIPSGPSLLCSNGIIKCIGGAENAPDVVAYDIYGKEVEIPEYSFPEYLKNMPTYYAAKKKGECGEFDMVSLKKNIEIMGMLDALQKSAKEKKEEKISG